MNLKHFIRYLFLVLSMTSCSHKTDHVNIFLEFESPQTEFAISNASTLFDTDKLIRVQSKENSDFIVSIDENNEFSSLKPEGFILQKSNHGKWNLIAKDPIGAMYGIFEVAEQLSFGKPLEDFKETQINPTLKNRFVKFNLPWSPYREKKAITLHEETCRDLEFWQSFLDMMAKNRLNVLSLWNLHPFMDMIQLEKYPEASTLSDAEFLERKKFWTSVLAMAKERGIQTYIVNWNIFLPEAFVKANNLDDYQLVGKHWGKGYNSELIEDYTRECVKQVINEYPDLTGIGLTLGEGMGGMTSIERKNWVNRTILKGMSMADRKVKLLYRAPLSAGKSSVGTTDKLTEVITREVLDTLSIPKETIISFKFNWSHGHSADQLFMVHGGKLTDTYWNPAPKNYSVLWTVRNEDFFTHRWAQPDFVRNFLKNNLSQSYMSGCIIGSECYIPAKDYFSNEKGSKHFNYAFERQWLWYSIWGRLLYDNRTKDEVFANQLNHKFNIDYGDQLLNTWKTASSYYHHFASLYRGSWDAALYSEAFTSIMRGPNVDRNKNKVDIITMKALGNRRVLDSINYININDYVLKKDALANQKITPVKLVDILNKNANSILKDLGDYRKKSPNEALEIELCDIELLANMQLFFAERIEATLLLANHLLLDKELNEPEIEKHLDASIKYWEQIIELKERFNKRDIPYVFNEKLDYHNYLNTLIEERENYQDIKEFWIHNVR
ncbi:MAG: hypothetical protein ACON5F_13330 [Jejuia sp.]